MGKPKRLYNNFIDPDVCRVSELIQLAKRAGFYDGSELTDRRSRVPHNPEIFDDFYREVVTTVSDYPYRLFIETANKAYNDVYDYILNEATADSSTIPDWIEDVFMSVEWTPVDTYIGGMLVDYTEAVKDSKISLESIVPYKIKFGAPARNVVDQVIASIVATVMARVYSDLRHCIECVEEENLMAFPNIPVKILWDSCPTMCPTVMTELDLDFAIRALRILSCYQINANVSQLVWLSSAVTLLHQVGECGSDEDECTEDEDVLDEE